MNIFSTLTKDEAFTLSAFVKANPAFNMSEYEYKYMTDEAYMRHVAPHVIPRLAFDYGKDPYYEQKIEPSESDWDGLVDGKFNDPHGCQCCCCMGTCSFDPQDQLTMEEELEAFYHNDPEEGLAANEPQWKVQVDRITELLNEKEAA